MTSAWSITASVNPPRAVFVDFPLGHTVGRPHEFDEQVAIMRDALQAAATIDEPGTIVALDYAWPESWKDEARALADHRSERYDTPQYQRPEDRDLAVGRYGDEIACGVCEPNKIPVN